MKNRLVWVAILGAALAMGGIACSTSTQQVEGSEAATTSSAEESSESDKVTLTDPAPAQSPEPLPTAELPGPTVVATATPAPTATPTPVPLSSHQVLADSDFDLLQNKRVGIITSSQSVFEGRRFVDVLNDHPDIELAMIFAPEHGFSASEERGEQIDSVIDATTGVEINSLYGPSRSPSVDVLEAHLDVLIFDLQDVGARPYTYLSTMGLAMQAAATAEIEFVVLDRPNPSGGIQVEGPVRTANQESFVGAYPVPLLHGMTAGETALAIVGEAWLPGVETLNLTVVPALHWNRNFKASRFNWVPPSPALVSADAALAYPGTVLFEATSVSYGRGTDLPFQVFGAPWLDTDEAILRLTALSLPGVSWRALEITPSDATDPNADVTVPAVEMWIFDPAVFQPVATATGTLTVLRDLAEESDAPPLISNDALFDRLAGTTQLRELLAAGADHGTIAAAWDDEVAEFRSLREKYLLYGE